MIMKLRTLGFALAALGLFACNQPDKIAGGPGQSANGTGSARFALPVMPQGALPKTGSVIQAAFQLTVSGEAMNPIQQTYVLTPGSHDSVTVTGIPAGYVRRFDGRLIQFDSAHGDTVVTHEGSDSAFIQRDSIAEVHLYLRKKNGGGGAHVCVEVEGWPSDSTCINPPIHSVPWFGGCWKVIITKRGATPKDDSLFKARLRIDQWDTSLVATFTWNSGQKDAYSGYVRLDGTAVILDNLGQVIFKGNLDATVVDTTNATPLNGYFNNPARGIFGSLAGSRTYCDSIPIEPPIIDTTRACFSVSQSLIKGKSTTGRLGLIGVTGSGSGYVTGYFHWKGFATMNTWGDSLGGPLDSASLRLIGTAPPGMVQGTGADTLAYLMDLRPGQTTSGTVQRVDAAGFFPNGTWKATPSACGVQDFQP
ncbi:MAG: hypothetical protein JWO30_795 [Fibrobacteres bacterium]|nr:hypothetical protein [Fibrobacterota bacterium]